MNAKKVLRAPLFWALMMLVLFMLVFRMGSGGEYARVDTSAAEQLVEDGKVVAAPMMYMALSYDHRIIDGKDAVLFLVDIKNQLENPHRMLLGI